MTDAVLRTSNDRSSASLVTRQVYSRSSAGVKVQVGAVPVTTASVPVSSVHRSCPPYRARELTEPAAIVSVIV
ncbi:hypothetical protein D3C75_1204320 [compost metagenome]